MAVLVLDELLPRRTPARREAVSSPPTTSLAGRRSLASSTLTCFFAVWLSAAPIVWAAKSLRGTPLGGGAL